MIYIALVEVVRIVVGVHPNSNFGPCISSTNTELCNTVFLICARSNGIFWELTGSVLC